METAKDRDRLADERHGLLFDVRRSVRYHNRRRAFYDRCNLFSSWVGVVFGSATVITLLSGAGPLVAALAAALVSLVSAFDLVVGTSRQARLHADLARRFIGLEKKIVARGSADEAELALWTQDRLDIEMEEPPILRVLDALCYREQMRSMGCYSDEELPKIGYWQGFWAQWIDIGANRLRAPLVQS